eukprot:scaffold14562_cov133-Isochrysis_galbana.AAC.3
MAPRPQHGRRPRMGAASQNYVINRGIGSTLPGLPVPDLTSSTIFSVLGRSSWSRTLVMAHRRQPCAPSR